MGLRHCSRGNSRRCDASGDPSSTLEPWSSVWSSRIPADFIFELRLNYAKGWDDSVPEQAYLTIKGSRIFYETSGHGEPLLLLHGGFGTVEDFSSQIPILAKHFKVVAFERPGHGHTADTAE